MAASTEEMESGKTEIEKVPAEETENGNIFQANECSVEKVVVYQDRAEVCRIIETKLKKGENEVILKNLSQWVDQDSIRVEGKGPATILEVTYQSKHINPSDEVKEGIKSKHEEFSRQLKVLESKLTEIISAKTRVEKQWKVLDQFSNSVTRMGASVTEQSDSRTVARLDKTQLDGISEFFKLYDSQSTRLDTSLLELNREIERVQTEKATLLKNMRESGVVKNTTVSRECSILLESQEPEDVDITLLVSYVVTNASWTPKYDIRVFPEEKKLKVMYYGVIKQSTDEDWEDSKLFLSTAMPSIGGTVPSLGRASVQIKRVYYPMRYGKSLSKSFSLRKKGAMKRHSVPQSIDLDEVGMAEGGMLKESELFGDTIEEFAAPVEVAQTQAKEGLTSTTFEITRPSSIPCDNVGHKVAVGIIDLSPEFEYESVPKLAPHAFLKARVANNSQYAFLPGPTNIFLDNNFVAKSELKAVSPAEEFVVSLGVDPAVRITYKPLNKFQEKSGLLTKIKTLTYKQDIEIKNTHTNPIQIKVIDHVPVSTEDKVKVNILEPALNSKHPEKVEKSDTMKLTKENHIEWELSIAGKEQREITLKYTIEHPAGDDLDTWTSPLD